MVSLVVEEIEGDVDTSNVNLTVPSEVLGTVADGGSIGVQVLTVAPGLSFFVVGAGDTQATVEEVEGDTDADSHWLVVDRGLLGLDDGTSLEGTTYQTPGGPVTLFQMP